MMILRDAIQKSMIESGRLSAGEKIEIISIEGESSSDYRRVELLAYKKRCRKPFMCWNICLDIARNIIHWDTTTFYRLDRKVMA